MPTVNERDTENVSAPGGAGARPHEPAVAALRGRGCPARAFTGLRGNGARGPGGLSAGEHGGALPVLHASRFETVCHQVEGQSLARRGRRRLPVAPSAGLESWADEASTEEPLRAPPRLRRPGGSGSGMARRVRTSVAPRPAEGLPLWA